MHENGAQHFTLKCQGSIKIIYAHLFQFPRSAGNFLIYFLYFATHHSFIMRTSGSGRVILYRTAASTKTYVVSKLCRTLPNHKYILLVTTKVFL